MNTKNIFIKSFAIANVLLLLVAPISSVTAQTMPQTASVSIVNNTYSPQTITVAVGQMVTWTNWDNLSHTVTSDTNLFNSGTLNYGYTFSVQFNSPGTFNYHCNFHNGMTGTVIVSNNPPPPNSNSLHGVVQPPQENLVINSITTVDNTGVADGTFENGWKWIFDVSAPMNETNLRMRFENWMVEGFGNSTIPVANNIRFYSAQSSNASTQASAIYINAPNTYSSPMILTGDLDAGTTRRVQITVEVRIPSGTTQSSFSTNFGVTTQP